MPSFFTPHPQSIPGANPAAATRPRCDFSPGCRRLVFPPSLLCRINTTPEAGKRQERGACRVSPRGDGGGHGSSSTSGGVMTAWPQGRAPCPLSGATQGCDTGTGGSAAQAEPRLAEPGGLPRAGNGMCIGLRSWGDEPNLAWCPQPKALHWGGAGARWKQQAGCQTHPQPSCFAHPALTPFSGELGLRMRPRQRGRGAHSPQPHTVPPVQEQRRPLARGCRLAGPPPRRCQAAESKSVVLKAGA